jgi:phosphate starvation-inducible protein PhoH
MDKKPRRRPAVVTEDLNQQHKSKKEIISTLIKKKTKDKFLSDSQREYYDILQNSQITICSGPAGVGKSYIAMKAAVDLLADPNNSYEKLIIVNQAANIRIKYALVFLAKR